MHREEQPLFEAPFFRKLRIQPYPISSKTMQLSEDFLGELTDSLKGGYDSTKPIIVSVCESDERLSGLVIDGRHRLYCLAKLNERGVKLPNPFPIAYLEVNSISQLRALRAQYEEKNRSKAAKYAKAWIEENIRGVVEADYGEHMKDIYSYIRSLGFTNDTIIGQVVDEYIGKENHKHKKGHGRGRPRKETGNRSFIENLPESLKQKWADEPASVYAGKDERFDIVIGYHSCPSCKDQLKITSDTKGHVIKIETAPKISP